MSASDSSADLQYLHYLAHLVKCPNQTITGDHILAGKF